MKMLHEYPQEPMTDHQMQAIMVCSMQKDNPAFFADIRAQGGDHLWRIIEAQSDATGLKLTDELKAFILLAFAPTPGALALWLRVCRHLAGPELHEVDMLRFNMAFANGYPSQASIEHAYEENKRAQQQAFDRAAELKNKR